PAQARPVRNTPSRLTLIILRQVGSGSKEYVYRCAKATATAGVYVRDHEPCPASCRETDSLTRTRSNSNMQSVSAASKDDVLCEEADGIATISLNRPEARNALSISAANRLHELWEAVDGSASIRVIILTSADCGTFCAGMDLKEAARIK